MFLFVLILGFIVAVDCLVLAKYIKGYKEDSRVLQEMFVSSNTNINHSIETLVERVTRLEEVKENYGKKNSNNSYRSDYNSNARRGDSTCSK